MENSNKTMHIDHQQEDVEKQEPMKDREDEAEKTDRRVEAK